MSEPVMLPTIDRDGSKSGEGMEGSDYWQRNVWLSDVQPNNKVLSETIFQQKAET